MLRSSVSSRHGGPPVANGEDDLQMWRVAANVVSKQSRTADKKWSSILGLRRGANNFPLYKKTACYEMLHRNS